jgi:hypothetical protein
VDSEKETEKSLEQETENFPVHSLYVEQFAGYKKVAAYQTVQT